MSLWQPDGTFGTGPRVGDHGCGQPSGLSFSGAGGQRSFGLFLTRVVLRQRVEGTVEVVDAVVQFVLEPFG
jgi:hypothetical protein